MPQTIVSKRYVGTRMEPRTIERFAYVAAVYYQKTKAQRMTKNRNHRVPTTVRETNVFKKINSVFAASQNINKLSPPLRGELHGRKWVS